MRPEQRDEALRGGGTPNLLVGGGVIGHSRRRLLAGGKHRGRVPLLQPSEGLALDPESRQPEVGGLPPPRGTRSRNESVVDPASETDSCSNWVAASWDPDRSASPGPSLIPTRSSVCPGHADVNRWPGRPCSRPAHDTQAASAGERGSGHAHSSLQTVVSCPPATPDEDSGRHSLGQQPAEMTLIGCACGSGSSLACPSVTWTMSPGAPGGAG